MKEEEKEIKKTSIAAVVDPETEAPEVYYNVYIYDNHGTINITQTGKPEEDPPTPTQPSTPNP